MLTSGLPKNWSTVGVSYDVDVLGDFCLGLRGGKWRRILSIRLRRGARKVICLLAGIRKGLWLFEMGWRGRMRVQERK